MIAKACMMCGKTYTPNMYAYYSLYEIKQCYQVHEFPYICASPCGEVANSFINYFGKKKESDLTKLRNYLNTGTLVQRKFSMLMNGGYWE